MEKRLFIGVPVSEEIKEKIKPLYQQLEDTGADLKFVSLKNLHFTLKFLGDVDESRLPEISGKINTAVNNISEFPIKVKKVGAFPNSSRINVIWIGVEDSRLISLMKKINEQLNYIKKEEHEELPHLTLARVKSAKNKEKLQEFLRKNEYKDFGEMIVDKIVLYESELTKEGPVYSVVREFGLKNKLKN